MRTARSRATTPLAVVDATLEAELREARRALAEWRLVDAKDRFGAVLRRAERPEGLEGLAVALSQLGDTRGALEARERAFALYRSRGDCCGSARAALGLALEHIARDEESIAFGWLGRAKRLLADVDPCPELAWLAVWEGHILFLCRNDLDAAKRRVAEGLELARRLRVEDAELLGIGLEGLALVAEGRVTEGLARLDESATAAVNGELADLDAHGQACCYLLRACEQVLSFDRASQWCERIQEQSRRHGMPMKLSYCRSHWAAILVWRGHWAEAERELQAEIEELAEVAPAVLPELRARLGELRRRQGRWDEADRLFAAAGSHPLALVGRAALAIDRAHPAQALRVLDRLARRLAPEDRASRIPAWLCQARAGALLGRRESVDEAVRALEQLAGTAATDGLRASVRLAEAWSRLADDPDQACRDFEDAADLYERARAPFEAACARLEQARVLDARGESEAAREAAVLARDVLAGLGAERLVHDADELLARLPVESGPDGAVAILEQRLSRRQCEVLRLVAQGLSNRVIGERLHVSELTVKRHVADILDRLDLPSRAAAAAFAARHGLL